MNPTGIAHQLKCIKNHMVNVICLVFYHMVYHVIFPMLYQIYKINHTLTLFITLHHLSRIIIFSIGPRLSVTYMSVVQRVGKSYWYCVT